MTTKFNHGDIVICNDNSHSRLVKGNEYKVDHESNGYVHIFENGSWSPSTGGWASYRFTKKEEAGTFIISVVEGKTFAPAPTPRIYTSKAQAKAVSISMAEKNPGARFVVLEAISYAETPVVVAPPPVYQESRQPFAI